MKLAIGADHAGYLLKEKVKSWLVDNGFEVTDFGTNSLESVDYPDYGFKVACKVATNEFERGILICSTGIGMSIVANRVPMIRGALCITPEMAQKSRAHNDSNILILAANIVDEQQNIEILKVWLRTPFDGGRHARRIAKIREIERRV